MLAVAACGKDRGTNDETSAPAAADAPQGDSAAPTQGAFTVTGRPVITREDSIREAIEDSTREARLYQQRLASMESYESCMAKTKDADPPQRAVLERACALRRDTAR